MSVKPARPAGGKCPARSLRYRRGLLRWRTEGSNVGLDTLALDATLINAARERVERQTSTPGASALVNTVRRVRFQEAFVAAVPRGKTAQKVTHTRLTKREDRIQRLGHDARA